MQFWRQMAWLLLAAGSLSAADVKNDLAALAADRAAVERVYFSHRIGRQGTFEQSMSPALLESLVQTDLNKEAVLKRVYGVTVTEGMVASEVHRIDATTRAPEILAELKSALDNDPDRFARAVARPLVVERVLRDHFANDAALSAGQKEEMEKIRAQLLAARKAGAETGKLLGLLQEDHSNEVVESTWLLTPRPVPQKSNTEPDEAEVQQRFGPNARLLSSPNNPETDGKLYIEDMAPDLRQVLLAQLGKAGDVSAVIEVESGYLLYLARDRTANRLDIACLALRKRDFDGWLQEQCDKLKL